MTFSSGRKLILYNIFFLTLILLEILFLFRLYREQKLAIQINELGFSIASFVVGCLLLVQFWNVKLTDAIPEKGLFFKWVAIVLTLIGIGVFSFYCNEIFHRIPIAPTTSDVIPTIQIAVRRFLSGKQVYSLVEFPGWSFPMTYLPLTWLPFTIAELGHFDYRWIAVGSMSLMALLLVFRSGKVSGFHALMLSMLFIFAGRFLIHYDEGIIGISVELMIAAFYMVFIIGLSGKSPMIRAIGISLCMLSRFSLVLWLPLWAVTELLANHRKAIYTFSLVMFLILALYIIPFLSNDWGYLHRAIEYYTDAAVGEWSRPNEYGIPNQLSQGVGFARQFFLNGSLTVVERIKALQLTHKLLSFGIPMIMGVWYWLYGRYKLNSRIFLMASFKIYLTFFLGFIQVPYTYLMITSIGVSLAIFAELPRYRKAYSITTSA